MDQELTIRQHIKELKTLSLKLLLPIIFLFIFFFAIAPTFTEWVFNYIGLNQSTVVALNPFENITARVQIAASLSVFFSIPILFLGIFGYIKPAISKKNQKAILIIFLSSILLAIIGVIIGILVFAKFMLFMLSTQYLLVDPMWSISSVIRYIITMSLTMAAILQIVIIIPLLTKSGLIKTETLQTKRPIIFIIISILSAIISPPDPLSMFLMIIPIYGSFEVGILISKIIGKKK